MLTGKKLIRRSAIEARTIRAVAHTHRIAVLHLLSDTDMRLKEIAAHMQISESLLVHHLGALIRAGLVGKYLVGARTFYRLEKKHLEEAKKTFSFQSP